MIDVRGQALLSVPGCADDRDRPPGVAGLLSEMDARLRMLQEELELVAGRGDGTRRPGAGAPMAHRPRSAPPLPAVDARGAVRSHATRRITAVASGSRLAAVAPPAPAGRPSAQPLDPVAAHALFQREILEAEEDARRVVEGARQQLADIGARTRARLEHSLAQQRQAAAATPAHGRSARDRRSRAARAEDHSRYEGSIAVEAGPFDDILQLGEFERTLASVPGVAEVHIRTLEQHHAVFDLHLDAPTALISELHARSADPLDLIEAATDYVCVEIGSDGARA